jgi:hypothetical protein
VTFLQVHGSGFHLALALAPPGVILADEAVADIGTTLPNFQQPLLKNTHLEILELV